MDDGLGTLRRWTVDGGGIRGCSHFVTNANTGDKAVTKPQVHQEFGRGLSRNVTKCHEYGILPLFRDRACHEMSRNVTKPRVHQELVTSLVTKSARFTRKIR